MSCTRRPHLSKVLHPKRLFDEVESSCTRHPHLSRILHPKRLFTGIESANLKDAENTLENETSETQTLGLVYRKSGRTNDYTDFPEITIVIGKRKPIEFRAIVHPDVTGVIIWPTAGGGSYMPEQNVFKGKRFCPKTQTFHQQIGPDEEASGYVTKDIVRIGFFRTKLRFGVAERISESFSQRHGVSAVVGLKCATEESVMDINSITPLLQQKISRSTLSETVISDPTQPKMNKSDDPKYGFLSLELVPYHSQRVLVENMHYTPCEKQAGGCVSSSCRWLFESPQIILDGQQMRGQHKQHFAMIDLETMFIRLHPNVVDAIYKHFPVLDRRHLDGNRGDRYGKEIWYPSTSTSPILLPKLQISIGNRLYTIPSTHFGLYEENGWTCGAIQSYAREQEMDVLGLAFVKLFEIDFDLAGERIGLALKTKTNQNTNGIVVE